MTPSHLKDVFCHWSKDFVTVLCDEHGVLKPYHSLCFLERYRLKGIVNKTINAVLMIVKERPIESVSKP